MGIIDNLIIIALIVGAFIGGLKLSDRYHDNENIRVKEALERQFLRLKTKMDADDPCKPYVRCYTPIQPTGDYDGDGPISPEFMKELKETGKAKTVIKKADIERYAAK